MGFLVDFIRSQGISLGATSGTSMISWDFTRRNQCFKGFRLLNGFQGIKGFSIEFEGFQWEFKAFQLEVCSGVKISRI